MICWEGSTFRKTITVLTGGPGSAPRNFTGFTALMLLRAAPDATPVYTLSTTNNQIVLGGTTGTVSLYIPAADTLTFDTLGEGLLYELTVTDAGGTGDIESLLWGPFSVQGIA